MLAFRQADVLGTPSWRLPPSPSIDDFDVVDIRLAPEDREKDSCPDNTTSPTSYRRTPPASPRSSQPKSHRDEKPTRKSKKNHTERVKTKDKEQEKSRSRTRSDSAPERYKRGSVSPNRDDEISSSSEKITLPPPEKASSTDKLGEKISSGSHERLRRHNSPSKQRKEKDVLVADSRGVKKKSHRSKSLEKTSDKQVRQSDDVAVDPHLMKSSGSGSHRRNSPTNKDPPEESGDSQPLVAERLEKSRSRKASGSESAKRKLSREVQEKQAAAAAALSTSNDKNKQHEKPSVSLSTPASPTVERDPPFPETDNVALVPTLSIAPVQPATNLAQLQQAQIQLQQDRKSVV